MKYVIMFTTTPDLEAEVSPEHAEQAYGRTYEWFGTLSDDRLGAGVERKPSVSIDNETRSVEERVTSETAPECGIIGLADLVTEDPEVERHLAHGSSPYIRADGIIAGWKPRNGGQALYGLFSKCFIDKPQRGGPKADRCAGSGGVHRRGSAWRAGQSRSSRGCRCSTSRMILSR